MSTEDRLPDDLWRELLDKYVSLYDRDGNFRSLSDIMQDISAMWDDAISAPNFTESVFDSDEASEPDDSDDNIEVALDSDIEELLGMKRGDLTRSL